jgi:glycosyltransferase involved in cell wall biosynthesis
VGRLAPAKAFPDLLTAFATLRQDHPTAALVIAGDGELRADLTAHIAQLGLQGHAFLLGSRNDVPHLLAASDLYINASHYEGLPLSILEAMSAARPIVATSVGDIPHVLVPGAGLLVPPAEPPALAAALRTLLDDPALGLALGRAAQSHVLHHYSPTAWFQQYLALYQTLVSTDVATDKRVAEHG